MINVFAHLQTSLNCLAYLLRSRARNTLLDVAVFEDAECRHLAHAKFLCDVFAFFDVVGVEFDLCTASANCSDWNKVRNFEVRMG